MAINLAYSERKSLRAFFSLYIFLVLFILGFIAFIYFQSEKKIMLSQWRLELQLMSESFLSKLKHRHIYFDEDQSYPRSKDFTSGIYDIDKSRIFSTLQTPRVNLNEVISLNDNFVQLVIQPEAYYLGAKYIVLEVEDDQKWFQEALKNILIFFSISFTLMLLIGWYLSKLFLRPMKQAVSLLDRFIKDTTHELNTPVATILSNIETINVENLDEKTARKIGRIDIASRTISTLYEDLTFLVLGHNIVSNDESINLGDVVKERLQYFELSIKQKKIELITEIDSQTIMIIDARKIRRLLDNLISNAIKYNDINGHLSITLTHSTLTITNSGRGISKEKLPLIFKRFVRADNVVGGFGIGLHIVSKIVDEYNISIDVNSEPNKETRIILSW
jgi:two-component system, OmpR family, sensor kinase